MGGDDKWVNKLVSDTDKGTKEWIEMCDVTGDACAGVGAGGGRCYFRKGDQGTPST